MTVTTLRYLNALKVGERERLYRVRTFCGRRGGMPYLGARASRWNPDWVGCVEYEVVAGSARAAKLAAIGHRKRNP